MKKAIFILAALTAPMCSKSQTTPTNAVTSQPQAMVDSGDVLVMADGYDPTVSITGSGLRVTWTNLSRTRQIGRTAWYCYHSWTAQRRAYYLQYEIAPLSSTTVSPVLPLWSCGLPCQVDVGYLTPWPPPEYGGPPVFGGLLAAGYATAICPKPTPTPCLNEPADCQ